MKEIGLPCLRSKEAQSRLLIVVKPEYFVIKNKGKVEVTGILQTGLWQWGYLKDTKEHVVGKCPAGPIYSVYLQHVSAR